MSKVSKTVGEKETIVRLSEDKEELMTVYTHRGGLAKRMKRLGANLKHESKIDGRVVAWTFECSSDWFKSPGPKKRSRFKGVSRPFGAPKEAEVENDG